MRIALCLSGKPRCYDYHWDTIKNLFSPHTVDVFAHFWEDEVSAEDKDWIFENYRPKLLLWEREPQEVFRRWHSDTAHNKAPGRDHYNTFPMRYSMFRANELKKQHENRYDFKYDAVCRARTDLWFQSDWNNALTQIKPDTVIIPHDRHYDGGYNDNIAVGDSASMDHYTYMWNWLSEALAIDIQYGIETMTREYLDNHTPCTVIQAPVQYKIIRPSHRTTAYENIPYNAYDPEQGIRIA